MPRLAAFYGIVIWMYRPDHPPPHFHGQYGEHIAQIELGTLRVLNGCFLRGRCGSSVNGRDCTQTSWRPTGSARRRSIRWLRSTRWRSMNPMLRVTDAEALDGHLLRVTFNDGLVRDVDCSFLLRGTLGEPLRDLAYFRQVRVDEDARTVVWPNGLDPAPELLHGDFERDAAARREAGRKRTGSRTFADAARRAAPDRL